MRMVEGHSKRLDTSNRSACTSFRGFQLTRATQAPPSVRADTRPSTGQGLQQLAWPRRGARLLTLERSFGEVTGVDAALWRSGRFAAEVWPDVPVASTWSGLLRAGLGRCAAKCRLINLQTERCGGSENTNGIHRYAGSCSRRKAAAAVQPARSRAAAARAVGSEMRQCTGATGLGPFTQWRRRHASTHTELSPPSYFCVRCSSSQA